MLALKVNMIALAPSQETRCAVGKADVRTVVAQDCTDNLAALEDRE